MAIKDLVFGLSLRSDNFDRKMKGAGADLKALASVRLDALREQMKGLGEGADALNAKQFENFRREYESLGKAMADVSSPKAKDSSSSKVQLFSGGNGRGALGALGPLAVNGGGGGGSGKPGWMRTLWTTAKLEAPAVMKLGGALRELGRDYKSAKEKGEKFSLWKRGLELFKREGESYRQIAGTLYQLRNGYNTAGNAAGRFGRIVGGGGGGGGGGGFLRGGIFGAGIGAGLAAFTGAMHALRSGIGAMMGFVRSVVEANAKLEQTVTLFTSLTGSEARAKGIVEMLRKEADVTPFETEDVVTAGKSLFTTAGNDEDRMMELVKLSERLAMLNPEEGLKGAAFALKEAMSGDFTSLKERFNIGKSEIEALKAQGLAGDQIIEKVLTAKNITQQTVDSMSKTALARLSTIRSFIDGMKTKLGVGVFLSLSDMMGKAGDWLAKNGTWVMDTVTGLGMALGDLFGKALASMGQLNGAATDLLGGLRGGFAVLAEYLVSLPSRLAASFRSGEFVESIMQVIGGIAHATVLIAVSAYKNMGQYLYATIIVGGAALATELLAMILETLDKVRKHPVFRLLTGKFGNMVNIAMNVADKAGVDPVAGLRKTKSQQLTLMYSLRDNAVKRMSGEVSDITMQAGGDMARVMADQWKAMGWDDAKKKVAGGKGAMEQWAISGLNARVKLEAEAAAAKAKAKSSAKKEETLTGPDQELAKAAEDYNKRANASTRRRRGNVDRMNIGLTSLDGSVHAVSLT